MAKDPAFIFYSKDWLEGTAEFLPEEKGVYIDLLCYHHQKGSLPSDPRRLALLVRLSVDQWSTVWSTIGCKFYESNGRLYNKKLVSVMDERASKAKKNSITSRFAVLIRSSKNLSKKDIQAIKEAFNAEEFMQYEKEVIDQEVTEWFNRTVTNLVNRSEDVIANVNGDKEEEVIDNEIEKSRQLQITPTEELEEHKAYAFIEPTGEVFKEMTPKQKKLLNEQLKVAADTEIPFSSQEFRTVFYDWLEHRVLINKPYKNSKSMGMIFTGDNAQFTELEMISAMRHSIQNEYQGLFPKKSNGKYNAKEFTKATGDFLRQNDPDYHNY